MAVRKQIAQPSTAVYNFSSVRDQLMFVWSILKDFRIDFLQRVMVMIGLTILSSVTPLFYKFQIDQLERQRGSVLGLDADPFLLFIGFLAGPMILETLRRLIIDPIETRLQYLSTLKIRRQAEKIAWEKLSQFDFGFFTSWRNKPLRSEGFNISRVVDDYLHLVLPRLTTFTRFITILPILLLIDVKLALLTLVAGLIKYAISRHEVDRSKKYSLAQMRRDHQSWLQRSLLERDFQHLNVLGEVPRMTKKTYEAELAREQLNLESRLAENHNFDKHWLVQNLSEIIISIWVGWQIMHGQLTIGTFALTLSYIQDLGNGFFDIINSITDWRELQFRMGRLHFFLTIPSRLKNSGRNLKPVKPDQLALKEASFIYPSLKEDEKAYLRYCKSHLLKNAKHGQLSSSAEEELNDIDRYLTEKEEKTWAVKNITLQVKLGEIIALVGPNGSGKTTLVHLLQNHYSPFKGQATLGAVNFIDIDRDWLWQQFAWVDQTPFLAAGLTIRENLLLGTSDQSDQKIFSVLKQLGADTFVNSLQSGLDSLMEADVQLSSGQRQLLAIARVILQDRPFIFLDEATSQLDAEKEFKVMSVLKRMATKKAIVFITHRMSVARKADYLYILDKGQLKENGKHEELIAKAGGLYARYWQMQILD